MERIQTWNAESYQNMIAVNEALGYTILGRPASWWKLDVAAPRPDRCRGWADDRSWPARPVASRGGRLLGAGDHADGLRVGHAQVQRRWPGRPAVRRRSAARRPCRSGPPRPGTTPGPGPRAALPPGSAPDGWPRRLGEVGVQLGLVVAASPAPVTARWPAAGRPAVRVAGSQHGQAAARMPRGARPGSARWSAGRARPSGTGAAGRALHVLADRVQRDDRDEEQREPAAPGPVPALAVPAAAPAVERALRDVR